MTLDTFAAAIREDFLAVRGDLATVKEDLRTLKSDVKNVKEDVANIKEIMVSKVDLRDGIRDELSNSQQAEEIENLRARLARVEQKLGFKQPAA